jgi:hypothetical protein
MVLAQMFLDAVVAVLKKARRGTLCLLDRSLNAASDREFLAPGLHRARRMKPFLLTLLAFALNVGGRLVLREVYDVANQAVPMTYSVTVAHT